MPETSRRSTSLRTAALWEQVEQLATARQEELGRALRVLDLGGGTGGLAVPLAALGHTVTLVDPSPDALAAARRRATDAGVADRVHVVQGDGDGLAEVCDPETGHRGDYDLACCHGTLEVVDDPRATLVQLAAMLAPGATLSLVVAGRFASVLARALAADFRGALQALTSADGRFGANDPLPRRFDAPGLESLLAETGYADVRVVGLRVFSDLVPAALVDSESARTDLLDLERAATSRPEASLLGQLGSSLHAIATLP